MKYTLEGIETERLVFRNLERSDFTIWQGLFQENKTAEFLGLDPKLTRKQLTEKWFEKVFHRYENDLGGMNVLIDKQSNKLVGQCGLLIQTIEEVKRMEVGYAVLPEFWGKGYASEAAIECKNQAFENDFTRSLISVINLDNIASEMVAKKNGMTFEKRIDEHNGSSVNVFRIDKPSNWKRSL